MAFCPNCGAEASGAYCPNCGTQIGASAGSSSGYSSTSGYSSASGATVGRSAGLSENAASALCYLLGFITGIIFLVLAPYNQNRKVRFHAWQSIFLSAVLFVLDLLLPAILHFVGAVLVIIINLAAIVLWIYLLFSVFNGKQVRLPLIADWADKQANR